VAAATMSALAQDDESIYDRGYTVANGLLGKMFNSCADDPKGSIHRAWGISLIFIILYFVLSILESKSFNLILLFVKQQLA